MLRTEVRAPNLLLALKECGIIPPDRAATPSLTTTASSPSALDASADWRVEYAFSTIVKTLVSDSIRTGKPSCLVKVGLRLSAFGVAALAKKPERARLFGAWNCRKLALRRFLTLF